MKKINEKQLRVLSLTATVLGVAGTLLSSYAGEKQLDLTVEQKIKEALEAMNKVKEG